MTITTQILVRERGKPPVTITRTTRKEVVVNEKALEAAQQIARSEDLGEDFVQGAAQVIENVMIPPSNPVHLINPDWCGTLGEGEGWFIRRADPPATFDSTSLPLRLHFDSTSATLSGDVLKEIAHERERQDKQWGGPAHDDTHGVEDWMDFIGDQITKFAHNMLHRGQAYFSTPDARQRLVKVAALAVAGLESLNRKQGAGQ